MRASLCPVERLSAHSTDSASSPPIERTSSLLGTPAACRCACVMYRSSLDTCATTSVPASLPAPSLAAAARSSTRSSCTSVDFPQPGGALSPTTKASAVRAARCAAAWARRFWCSARARGRYDFHRSA